MKLCLTLALALLTLPFASSPAVAGESGLISTPSKHSVAETVARLEAAIGESGDFTVLFKLDHAAAAAKVGSPIKPMQLVLFGNPKAGSMLQAAAPTIGLDLPMRALVWEDAAGKVVVTVNSAVWLLGRHGLAAKADISAKIDARLAAFVQKATE